MPHDRTGYFYPTDPYDKPIGRLQVLYRAKKLPGSLLRAVSRLSLTTGLYWLAGIVITSFFPPAHASILWFLGIGTFAVSLLFPITGGGGRSLSEGAFGNCGGGGRYDIAGCGTGFAKSELTSTVASGVWSWSLRRARYNLLAATALISLCVSSGVTATVTELVGMLAPLAPFWNV